MKKILIIGFVITFIQSCVFIRTDDSIDLGSKYRFIQDYPKTIIYHISDEYEGAGKEIVSPNVSSYQFNKKYIIAKSIDIESKELKYWIVDKATKGSLVKPLDSITFYQKLKELNINLKLNK